MTRARLSHFILLAAVGHALNPLPAAVATVRRAGVDVHIVGAIHSTPTSARDVDETVRATRPSAVVLELCGGRWRGLLNAREREVATPPSMRGELRDWWNSSVRTKAAIGAAPALISASLSLPYAVMRATGSDSFRPGSEFLAVVEAGAREGGALARPRIILGDIDAADTLTGLARALQLRAYGGRGAAATLAHARRQFGVLRRALGLDDASALRLGAALGRAAAMRDALVLSLPATLALVAVELVFGGGGTSGGGGPLALDDTTEHAIVALNAILSLWIVLGAPDAIEAMLDKRDDALASAIEHACNEADERSESDAERGGAGAGGPRPAVVAVVGMLHVNGVAARLAGASPPDATPPRPHRDWARGRGLRAGRLLVADEHVAASSPYHRAVLLLAEPDDPRAAAATAGWVALRLDSDLVDADASGARAGGPCARPTSLDRATAASADGETSPRRYWLHRTARLARDGDATLAEWGGSPLVIASDETAASELELDGDCGIELVGCSAWWPGQLEVEVAAGDWHVVDAPADASGALFGTVPINETSLAWARLVPQAPPVGGVYS